MIRPGWLSSHLTTAVREDLDSIKNVDLVTLNNSNVSDPDPKVQLDRAKKAGAEIAVIGAATVNADKLAVTGDVYDVSTGNSFGNFKASGATRDLFKVQDSIVHQIHYIVSRIASPRTSAGATPTATPGQIYEGSNLQASLNDYNFRGLQYANTASTNYTNQPYHVVEPPDINFILPYAYGGYGYDYYGWPSYSYYNPYYNPYSYGGYWNPWGSGIIIINQDFLDGHHHRSGNGNNTTPTPTPPVQHTVPPEIRTRGNQGSVVATPPPNTIQKVPSYEIRPVQR
jgi:TolB-like protein